jgi:DNA-binding beta-propeller fold protein YncE
MDWYAGNILSVTGEYFGVEKTIEKEFEVFKNQGGSSSNYGAGATDCAHVGPFSVATQETVPTGIAFSKSGEKMFIVGSNGDDVNEYTLTGAYCIGTASFVDAFSVATQETVPEGIAFSKSGEKMFIVGSNGDDVNEYTLTTAWDVSSASFVDAFSVATQESKPTGIAFSKSGTKMFVVGSAAAAVHEYTLSTAWDVSTASYVDYFFYDGQATVAEGLAFSKSGTKMFIVGLDDFPANEVQEYTLSTAWDVSTASYVDDFSIVGQESSPTDIWFDSSGKTMFIVGSNGDDVNVYKLTTAWDVSTASFVS